MQILQAGAPVTELQLTAGQTYTFRVNNTSGGIEHNLYLGPADRLAAADIADLPGAPTNTTGVQEFTWTATADAATWQFACVVLGHYQLMHGELTIDGQ